MGACVVKYVSGGTHGKPTTEYVAFGTVLSLRAPTIKELARKLSGADTSGMCTYGLSGSEILELYGALKKDMNVRT